MTIELVVSWKILEGTGCSYRAQSNCAENASEYTIYVENIFAARNSPATVPSLTQLKENALRHLESTPIHARLHPSLSHS